MHVPKFQTLTIHPVYT